MQRNLTVVGVLHELNLAAKYADLVLMLHGGKLMVQGSPESVFTPENIYSVFQIQARLLEQNQTFHFFLIDLKVNYVKYYKPSQKSILNCQPEPA